MGNTEKKKRKREGVPFSFRFEEETLRRLRVLADMDKRSQANLLSCLIDDEYERKKAEDSEKFRAAEKEHKTLKRR